MRFILEQIRVASFSLSLLLAICEQPATAAESPSSEGSRETKGDAFVQPLPDLVEQPASSLDLPSQAFRADINPEYEGHLPALNAGADLLIYGPPSGFGVSQSGRAAAIPAYRAHFAFNATNGLGAKVAWWAVNSPYSTGQPIDPTGQLTTSLNLSELRAEAAYTTAFGSGDICFSGGFALVSLNTLMQRDQRQVIGAPPPVETNSFIIPGPALGTSSPLPTSFSSRLVNAYSIVAPGFTLGVTGRQRIAAMKSAWVLASLQWTNVFGDARYSSNLNEWADNYYGPLAMAPENTAFNQLSLLGFRLGPSWAREFDNGVTLTWSATMEAEIVTQLAFNSGSMRAEGSVLGMGANFGLAR